MREPKSKEVILSKRILDLRKAILHTKSASLKKIYRDHYKFLEKDGK